MRRRETAAMPPFRQGAAWTVRGEIGWRVAALAGPNDREPAPGRGRRSFAPCSFGRGSTPSVDRHPNGPRPGRGLGDAERNSLMVSVSGAAWMRDCQLLLRGELPPRGWLSLYPAIADTLDEEG